MRTRGRGRVEGEEKERNNRKCPRLQPPTARAPHFTLDPQLPPLSSPSSLIRCTILTITNQSARAMMPGTIGSLKYNENEREHVGFADTLGTLQGRIEKGVVTRIRAIPIIPVTSYGRRASPGTVFT